MAVHMHRAAPRPGDGPAQPQDPAAWLRQHGVTAAALSMLAVQLLLMASVLAHAYFRQDDYYYLDRALTHGFSWPYLMMVDAGHLLPAGFAIAWAMARVSLYNGPLTCVATLALMAAAGLAALRMLRTLFGSRPAILIPLAVYLFSPLTLAPVAWWSVALEELPLELGLFLAVSAHVRYLRSGRFRSALAAAGWLLLGMAGMDKGAVLPILLFAVTSAFFVEGRWPAAIVLAARRYWRAWLLYAAVLAGYCALFFLRLPAYRTAGQAPVTPVRVLSFLWTLVSSTVVPGAMGGPWRWQPLAGGSALAAPPAPLVQLACGLAILIIVASCLYRVGAWRAWAILLGWIAAADVLPVVIGRLGVVPAGLLGLLQRYATDAVPVLVLCLGLAFVPVAGGAGRYRFRQPAASAAGPALSVPPGVAASMRAGCVLLGAVMLAGSFWSLQALQGATRTQNARSYIATARAAVAQAPRRAVIVDRPTPPFIMNPVFFRTVGATSWVIGALARGNPGQFSWVRSPRGVVRNPMIFDPQGRLWPAAVAGVSSGPPPQRCWDLAGSGIPLPHPVFRWGWTVRLDYSGPATAVAVGLGGNSARVLLPAGDHSFYLPLGGAGQDVSVLPLSPAPSLCLTGVTVGTWQPLRSGQPVPATPVAG